MKILITGNMGYVGPTVVAHLRQTHPGCVLIGYDSGYFAHCLTNRIRFPELGLDQQYFGDVRALPDSLLAQVDAVVALAAISNDPMGSRFEAVTHDINSKAVVGLAQRSIRTGVKRFVFASSCSMYGYADGPARRETDALNPLTAYARSKVDTETALAQMDPRGTTFTSLRFSTACGMSDRLRLDLVLNDFVACAIAAKLITVLSDGSPWRPLIDVADMARAIEWALIRAPQEAGPYVAVNVGSDDRNWQVSTLANAVAQAIPGTTVQINTNAPPDRRSYKVDFALFRSLAPQHQPQVSLEQSISKLAAGLANLQFGDSDFRSSDFMRLRVLQAHVESGRLDANLRWVA